MIRLPHALAPWRPALDIFDAEVAASLGPLLGPLSLAIGPMRTTAPRDGGDPDGLGGLGRRGSYERLLLSEWLLADEAPLEFVRRAASGEHAFLQIARRSPARAATSVALFDAGPESLGAPRVAHLALLIVLAARAERAGARFAWGLLHQPDRALFTAVTEESVTALLAGRTAIATGEGELEAWIERARDSLWEDAFMVGAREQVAGWRHGLAEVREVLDPARRALAVTVRGPAASGRRIAIELDLPPERLAARMLQDPFASPPPPPPAPAREPATASAEGTPIGGLVFAPGGAKLFARAESGEVIVYAVPRSPSGGSRKAKRFRARAAGVIAAAGWRDRGLVMLVIQEGALALEHTAKAGLGLLGERIALPPKLEITPPTALDPISLLSYSEGAEGPQILFTDARRRLFRAWRVRDRDLGAEPAVTRVAHLATEVSAMAEVGGDLAAITREDAATGFMLQIFGDRPMDLPLEGDGTFEACFGWASPSQRPLSAVQSRGDLWAVHQRDKPLVYLEPADGAQVIGVWRSGPTRPAALVQIERHRRSVAVIAEEGVRRSPKTDAPIVEATMSTALPIVAWLTSSGEVGLWSIERDELLARYPASSIR